MSIICDSCGKHATVKDCPPDVDWFNWLMDERLGDDAMITKPGSDPDRTIVTICFKCITDQVNTRNLINKFK